MSDINKTKGLERIHPKKRPLYKGNALLTAKHLAHFKSIDVPKTICANNYNLYETIVVDPISELITVYGGLCISTVGGRTKYTKDYRVWQGNPGFKLNHQYLYERWGNPFVSYNILNGDDRISFNYSIDTKYFEQLIHFNFQLTPIHPTDNDINGKEGKVTDDNNVYTQAGNTNKPFKTLFANRDVRLVLTDSVSGKHQSNIIIGHGDKNPFDIALRYQGEKTTVEDLRFLGYSYVVKPKYSDEVKDITEFYDKLAAGELYCLRPTVSVTPDLISNALYLNGSTSGDNAAGMSFKLLTEQEYNTITKSNGLMVDEKGLNTTDKIVEIASILDPRRNLLNPDGTTTGWLDDYPKFAFDNNAGLLVRYEGLDDNYYPLYPEIESFYPDRSEVNVDEADNYQHFGLFKGSSDLDIAVKLIKSVDFQPNKTMAHIKSGIEEHDGETITLPAGYTDEGRTEPATLNYKFVPWKDMVNKCPIETFVDNLTNNHYYQFYKNVQNGEVGYDFVRPLNWEYIWYYGNQIPPVEEEAPDSTDGYRWPGRRYWQQAFYNGHLLLPLGRIYGNGGDMGLSSEGDSTYDQMTRDMGVEVEFSASGEVVNQRFTPGRFMLQTDESSGGGGSPYLSSTPVIRQLVCGENYWVYEGNDYEVTGSVSQPYMLSQFVESYNENKWSNNAWEHYNEIETKAFYDNKNPGGHLAFPNVYLSVLMSPSHRLIESVYQNINYNVFGCPIDKERMYEYDFGGILGVNKETPYLNDFHRQSSINSFLAIFTVAKWMRSPYSVEPRLAWFAVDPIRVDLIRCIGNNIHALEEFWWSTYGGITTDNSPSTSNRINYFSENSTGYGFSTMKAYRPDRNFLLAFATRGLYGRDIAPYITVMDLCHMSINADNVVITATNEKNETLTIGEGNALFLAPLCPAWVYDVTKQPDYTHIYTNLAGDITLPSYLDPNEAWTDILGNLCLCVDRNPFAKDSYTVNIGNKNTIAVGANQDPARVVEPIFLGPVMCGKQGKSFIVKNNLNNGQIPTLGITKQEYLDMIKAVDDRNGLRRNKEVTYPDYDKLIAFNEHCHQALKLDITFKFEWKYGVFATDPAEYTVKVRMPERYEVNIGEYDY